MEDATFDREAERFWKNLEKEDRDKRLQAQEISEVVETLMAYSQSGQIELNLCVAETTRTLQQWRDRGLELKDFDAAAILQHALDFLKNCDDHGIIDQNKMTVLEAIDIFVQRRNTLLD